MSNPWAQAPSASDWQIQPSYPRHGTVPYYLAPLWDTHYAHKEKTRGSKSKRSGKGKDASGVPQPQIPKELRTKLKRARAAHGLLQDLEEQIRSFVQQWNDKQSITEAEGLADAPLDSDDDDDEIVFVGRNGQMHDSPGRKSRFKKMDQDMGVKNEKDDEKVVFESFVEDRGGIFGFVSSHIHLGLCLFVTDIISLSAVGLSTAWQPTTVYAPGPRRLVIRLVVLRMSVSATICPHQVREGRIPTLST